MKIVQLVPAMDQGGVERGVVEMNRVLVRAGHDNLVVSVGGRLEAQIVADGVGLRLTWMYDLPESKMKLNSNILVNLRKAYDEGTTIKAATHEYRGVTYVWEVVKNLEKAIALPGGIYNFGCPNHLNSHSLFTEAAHLMNLSQPAAWILPDTERFAEQEALPYWMPDHPLDFHAVLVHRLLYRFGGRADVYSPQGRLILRQADTEAIRRLTPGS